MTTPTRQPADLGRIQQELQQRDSLLWGKISVRIAIGLPLAILPPFAFAILLTMWAWSFDLGFNSFIVWFLLGCAIWFPLSYKYVSRKAGESFFADEMIEVVGGDEESWQGDPNDEEMILKQHKANALEYLDIALIGPRDLYEAYRLSQERRKLGEKAHQRAAEVIQALSGFDKGVPWLELRKENETVHQLLDVLGYLKLTDWIGTGTDGKRVWLLSDVRKTIMGH